MSSTPIETIECVLMECPLFTAVRRKYLIVNGCLVTTLQPKWLLNAVSFACNWPGFGPREALSRRAWVID